MSRHLGYYTRDLYRVLQRSITHNLFPYSFTHKLQVLLNYLPTHINHDAAHGVEIAGRASDVANAMDSSHLCCSAVDNLF